VHLGGGSEEGIEVENCGRIGQLDFANFELAVVAHVEGWMLHHSGTLLAARADGKAAEREEKEGTGHVFFGFKI
jgi:hypothetical protein